MYKRKCCIRAGHSGKYEPPKSVKSTLGLLDGVPVPNPAPPPEADAPRPNGDEPLAWLQNPWGAYLKTRVVAKSGLVEALAEF